MALPRSALLGILGAVLILVTFVATHGVGKRNDSGSPAPAPVQHQASTPKKATTPAASKPQVTKSAPAQGGRNVARHTSPATTHSKTSSKPAQAKTGSTVGLPLKVAQALADH